MDRSWHQPWVRVSKGPGPCGTRLLGHKTILRAQGPPCFRHCMGRWDKCPGPSREAEVHPPPTQFLRRTPDIRPPMGTWSLGGDQPLSPGPGCPGGLPAQGHRRHGCPALLSISLSHTPAENNNSFHCSEHSMPTVVALMWPHFIRGGKQSSERPSDWPKITQPVSSRVGIQTQLCQH